MPGRVTDDLGLGEWSCEGPLGNALVFAEQREQRPEGNRREMAGEVQSEPGVRKRGIANSTSYPIKMKSTDGCGSRGVTGYLGKKSRCRQVRIDREIRKAVFQTSGKSVNLPFHKKDRNNINNNNNNTTTTTPG